MQSPLHLLAHGYVFLLDLVRESDGLLHRFPARTSAGLREIPLEDRQRAVRTHGQDHIRAEVVLVDVQHRVREDPVVERILLRARHPDITSVAAWYRTRFQLADRSDVL